MSHRDPRFGISIPRPTGVTNVADRLRESWELFASVANGALSEGNVNARQTRWHLGTLACPARRFDGGPLRPSVSDELSEKHQ